jgi:hypothetical protein
MHPVRSHRFVVAAAVAAGLATFSITSAGFAASGKPLILDTRSGINDGQSGTVLQTAPLSRAPIVQAPPTATSAELIPNSSVPIVVAPYIQVPGAGAGTAQQSQFHPAPRQQ